MPNSVDSMRRWLGLLFLALAFGFLVWGQTVFRERLNAMAFLDYWYCCFLFTKAAIIGALLDLRATGKSALNVDPFPGALVMSTRSPPMARASLLDRANPSPVPPYLRVVELSACTKA